MITFPLAILAVVLAGAACTRWFKVATNKAEFLGLSVLLGSGVVTLLMFGTHALGFALEPRVYGGPVLLFALAGVAGLLRGEPLVGWRALCRPSSLVAALPFQLLTAFLVVVALARGLLIPNRFYDSITSFDLLGSIMAREEVFRISLFDTTTLAQGGGTYPPFTALSFAWGYQCGAVDSTHTILLPFVGFLFWIYGAARRRMGATSATALLAACLASPDFFAYLSTPLSNVAVAAYGALALFYANEAARLRRDRPLWLSGAALVLVAWTRTDGLAVALGVVFALFVVRGAVRSWWRPFLVPLPALALALSWEWFASNVLGRGGTSRLTMAMGWDAARLRVLVAGMGIFGLYPASMGFSSWGFVPALVSWWATRRAEDRVLWVATLVSFLAYTAFFYFVNPETQADLQSLLRSSYRRGLTAFVVPFWLAAFLSPLGGWVRARGAELFGVSRPAPPASPSS